MFTPDEVEDIESALAREYAFTPQKQARHASILDKLRDQHREPKIVAKVRNWATARVERLKSERAMGQHACEFAESDEPETGYNGVPRCYLSGNDIVDWCEPCRKRDVHFRTMLAQRKVERAAFSRLVAAAERLVE